MRATGLLTGLVLFALPVQAQLAGRIDAGLAGPAAWSTGLATASWYRPVAGPVLFELTGTAQGQHGGGINDAGSAWGGARLHLHSADRGIWLGMQGGRDYLGPIRRWEAAAWKNIGQLSIQVQGWQTATSLAQSVGADSGTGLPDTLSPRSSTDKRIRTTTDVGLWVRWGSNRAELAVASGMRFGLRQPGLTPGTSLGDQTGSTPSSHGTLSSTWWMVEATWWAMDRIGLVGSVGRQPTDPWLASTGQSFLRVGFRAALQRRRSEPMLVAPSRLAAFRARRESREVVEFTLMAPEAQRVELMGDFTDWAPVTMKKEGDLWKVRLPATPGLHRLNVRYDGGAWRAPPVARIFKDEFGQESGEVMIG